MSSVINNNSVSGSSNYGTPDVSQCMVPTNSVMHNEIQRIVREMLSNFSDLQYNYGFGVAVKNTVEPVMAAQSQSLLKEVEGRLGDHLAEVARIESDPLHEVRKRVAAFRLT